MVDSDEPGTSRRSNESPLNYCSRLQSRSQGKARAESHGSDPPMRTAKSEWHLPSKSRVQLLWFAGYMLSYSPPRINRSDENDMGKGNSRRKRHRREKERGKQFEEEVESRGNGEEGEAVII